MKSKRLCKSIGTRMTGGGVWDMMTVKSVPGSPGGLVLYLGPGGHCAGWGGRGSLRGWDLG